jgi:hypothetical protein
VSIAELTLVGTWAMDEVRLAVQKEYKFVDVHKIYEYKLKQYDPQQAKAGFLQNTSTFSQNPTPRIALN